MPNTQRIFTVYTDFGDDPDDAAAAVDYMTSNKYDKINIIITSGDTEKRFKIFNQLFSEWFTYKRLTVIGDNVMKNEYGTKIYVYLGDNTDRKINTNLLCEEEVSHHPDNCLNSKHVSDMLYTNAVDGVTHDILVAAPLVGLVIPNEFKPSRVVVVGNDPKLGKLAVNTGSGLNGSLLSQSNTNFETLSKCDNIVYLPAEHTRRYAEKFNSDMISRFPIELQNHCYEIITKFLIGPRPHFLPPAVQKSVACTNAQTLNNIIEQMYGKDMLKISSMDEEMAEAYCEKRIGESTEDDDVYNTALISAAIYKLTGERLKNNLEKGISRGAQHAFIEKMQKNPKILGMPNYDGYGYYILTHTEEFTKLKYK